MNTYYMPYSHFRPDKEINANLNAKFFFSKDLSGRMTISEIKAVIGSDTPRLSMYLKYNYCKETRYKKEQAFKGISVL